MPPLWRIVEIRVHNNNLYIIDENLETRKGKTHENAIMPQGWSPAQTCAVSLNAAGSISHLWQASALAVRLRRTGELPRSCRQICFHVSVDAEQFNRLHQEGLLPALHSIWDSVSPYPPTPPMQARGRGRSASGRSALDKFQGTPEVWLKRILALRTLATRYGTVVQLDSDSFPCSGWTHLFDTRASHQVGVLSARPVVPFSGSSGDSDSPAPPSLPRGDHGHWTRFHERNLGFVLLHTASTKVRALLADFGREFVRQVNDSTLTQLVRGAWRIVGGGWYVRCAVRGAWCVVRGAWCVVDDGQLLAFESASPRAPTRSHHIPSDPTISY